MAYVQVKNGSNILMSGVRKIANGVIHYVVYRRYNVFFISNISYGFMLHAQM